MSHSPRPPHVAPFPGGCRHGDAGLDSFLGVGSMGSICLLTRADCEFYLAHLEPRIARLNYCPPNNVHPASSLFLLLEPDEGSFCVYTVVQGDLFLGALLTDLTGNK